jgi:hypothetical protein
MFPPHVSPFSRSPTFIDLSINDGNLANRRNTQHVRSGSGPSLTPYAIALVLPTSPNPPLAHYYEHRTRQDSILAAYLVQSNTVSNFSVRAHLVYFGLGIQDCSQCKQHHSAISFSTQYPERSGAVIAPVVFIDPPQSRNMYSLVGTGSSRFNLLRSFIPYSTTYALPYAWANTPDATF